MSRNLIRTTCYFCPGKPLLQEDWRDVTKDDAGGYYERYAHNRWMFANAECPLCLAKYLAWGTGSPPHEIVDLSFRSTFNDEPGDEDLPVYEIKTIYERVGPYKRK